MNKIAQYLQEHISGEIITSNDVRKTYSTDASILSITPNVVVYPRNENDVRKTARFCWQLAERGRVFPITARGAGTDLSGAAIGSGIILQFPAHMNRVLELNGKTGDVTVEPGINYGKLQQTLYTHDYFLPPYPSSIEYSTIGGALANNAGGDKSIKYGSTIDFVKRLRVVLANGDIIDTERVGKRELNRKLGLSTFEGEIYRSIDSLIEENKAVVDKLNPYTTKNSSGYNLHLVKQKDGSFDLTPLFIGSQGTLGIITEASLTTVPRRVNSTLVVAYIEDIEKLQKVIREIRKFPEGPSSLELVDDNLIKHVKENAPNLIKDVVKDPIPKFILLVEFDNTSEHTQKRLAKKLTHYLRDMNVSFNIESDLRKKEELWKIRHSTTSVLNSSDTAARPIPIIEDGIVPPEKLAEYLTNVYQLFADNNLPIAVYGHAGDGHFHLQPLLNIKEIGDRQKIFKIMTDYYRMVIKLDGSISGENGDGRIRGAFLPQQFGPEGYELLRKVKIAFDPHNILNPGVKIGVSLDDIKPLIRDEYSLGYLHSYLPYF